MLERLASQSRMVETLKRQKRSFSRAKYYGDEAEMRRIRSDIHRLRKLILLRQEFYDDTGDDGVVTIEKLFERFG